jgi:hypothetical protein
MQQKRTTVNQCASAPLAHRLGSSLPDGWALSPLSAHRPKPVARIVRRPSIGTVRERMFVSPNTQRLGNDYCPDVNRMPSVSVDGSLPVEATNDDRKLCRYAPPDATLDPFRLV